MKGRLRELVGFICLLIIFIVLVSCKEQHYDPAKDVSGNAVKQLICTNK